LRDAKLILTKGLHNAAVFLYLRERSATIAAGFAIWAASCRPC